MPKYRLYYHDACPYCIRVLSELKKMGTEVELRDVLRNSVYRHKLVQRGGRYQVPCLQIIDNDTENEWLYESAAIIARLHEVPASIN